MSNEAKGEVRQGRRVATLARSATPSRRTALALAVACALSASVGDARGDATDEVDAQPPSQIVMLGTGTPLNEPSRSGPSVAIVVADTAYLVDFGAGVVRQAHAASNAGIDALAPWQLGFAFATHLHSDHTSGLANLALAPWVLGRDEPLELYGPPGIGAMAKHISSAYAEDIEIRSGPLSFRARGGSRINAHDVAPGIVFQNPHLKVEAFPVEHGAWKHAYGYRFETPDRSIVISGDTRPSESLVEKAKGCDVLIHEVYLKRTFDKLEPGLRAYHGANHTSGVALGKLAARVEPGLLIATHILLFGGTVEELEAEIRRHYKGKLEIARDLDVF